MTPIRCVVIDDEPFALDLIKDYVKRTPFLELTASFSNPFKSLDFIHTTQVDLLFLDINMPELSGIELYKSLPLPPKVIFTTAYAEFAAESYEYNAVDYLVKPIRYDRFLKAVNKASTLLKSGSSSAGTTTQSSYPPQDPHLFLKSGNQQIRVHPDEINYVEAAGNYMTFMIGDKKVMSLMTMKEVLELLPEETFIRVHKSYVISINHLEAIEKHDVVIAGKQIPIGVTYREHFVSRMKS